MYPCSPECTALYYKSGNEDGDRRLEVVTLLTALTYSVGVFFMSVFLPYLGLMIEFHCYVVRVSEETLNHGLLDDGVCVFPTLVSGNEMKAKQKVLRGQWV